MVIYINSRKVNPCKLTIYVNDLIVYQGYIYSRSITRADIGKYTGGQIRFSWDFDLSSEILKDLEMDDKCPENGILAYDDYKHVPFFSKNQGTDYIEMSNYYLRTSSIIETVISDIPKEWEELHVYFRRTKVLNNFAVLDIARINEKKKVKVTFLKNTYADEILEKNQKIYVKEILNFIIHGMFGIVILILLEKYFPQKILIYPVIFYLGAQFLAAIIIGQEKKELLNMLEHMDCI